MIRADTDVRQVRIDTRDSLWEIITGEAGIVVNEIREELSAVDEVLCTVDDYNYFEEWVNRGFRV